jgi:hypothetical protein
MAPRPDPTNPRLVAGRDKVDGTPYYKKREIQPGFPGAAPKKSQFTPGSPNFKREAQGRALQNTAKKYGNWGRPV